MSTDHPQRDDRSDAQAGPPTAPTSVVIAAHTPDRWPLLVRAIASVRAQPGSPQLVLAVDNHEELFTRARSTFADVTVVLNSGERGASVTRNVGAKAADGDRLVFLDDDAEALPGWLPALVRPLEDPDVVGVGGGVLPDWHSRAPRWFPMEFGWVVGASYTGMPTSAAPIRNVWSENMAVRASDFHAVGGFREGFGKVGNASRPEDTEFCVRLQAQHPEQHWWYEPAALVRHHVPAERAGPGFFLRRCLAEGRGKAALAGHVGRASALETEQSYVLHTLTAGAARGVVETGRGDPSGLLRSTAIVAGAGLAGLGYLLELVDERRGQRSAAAVGGGR